MSIANFDDIFVICCDFCEINFIVLEEKALREELPYYRYLNEFLTTGYRMDKDNKELAEIHH